MHLGGGSNIQTWFDNKKIKINNSHVMFRSLGATGIVLIVDNE